MLYEKFIAKPINPKTKVSEFFDEHYYTSEASYRNIIASPSPKNYILNTIKREIIILKAYGVANVQVRAILIAYKPELDEVNKDAISTIITRWCVYYSYHLEELYEILGSTWQAEAERLIEFYITHKNDKQTKNKYLTAPVEVTDSIKDIKNLLNKLILYTQLEIPEAYNIKELKDKEQDIKNKINKCEDVEIFNGYYSELTSILRDINESRKNAKNAKEYKAIRVLKTCGFLEAAYKWLDCFPDR